MRHTLLLLLLACLAAGRAHGFGASEEKFIKKYAMMKVYESCFGLQVLKEVRKEMKEAAQKCAGFTPDFDDKYVNYEPTELIKEHYTTAFTTERTRPTRPSADRTTSRPLQSADTLLIQQWAEGNQIDEDLPQGEPSDENETEAEMDTTPAPTRKPLDLSKLEEAIMSINRPGAVSNHLGIGQRPVYAPPGSSPNYQAPPPGGYYPPMFYPPPMPYPPSYYNPYYPGYYQPQAPAAPAAPYTPYYSRSGYRSAKITKGFVGQKPVETESTLLQVSGGRQKKLLTEDNKTATTAATPNRRHRAVSDAPTRGRTLVPPKDLDVKASIDAMTYHSGANMRNITCVMQELGYLDEKLEPNYERMIERIEKLHASAELKKDMVDGVKFCRQFSQCVPDIRKDKYQLSKEFLRPMFFFRCYKHKKLESCIMKDVRDRFATSSATAFEDSSAMANELRRSFSSKSDVASNIFEFMYGSSADDFDAIL